MYHTILNVMFVEALSIFYTKSHKPHALILCAYVGEMSIKPQTTPITFISFRKCGDTLSCFVTEKRLLVPDKFKVRMSSDIS